MLSGDLIGHHGALDTAAAAYRAAVRAPFAYSLVEPQGDALVVDGPLTGISVALVPALGADGKRVEAPELASPGPYTDPTPPIFNLVNCDVPGGGA